MAIAFRVKGPHKIQVAIGAGNYSDLGRGDNQDLVTITRRPNQEKVRTNLSGATPAQVINDGELVTLQFSFVEWDVSVFKSVLAAMRGGSSAIGRYSLNGTQLVATDTLLKFKLLPDNTGFLGYEFFNFLLDEDRLGDIGNKAERLVVTAYLVRPASATHATDYMTEITAS